MNMNHLSTRDDAGTIVSLATHQALLGDEDAQAFIDAGDAVALSRAPGEARPRILDLRSFPLITRVPLRISKNARCVDFTGCRMLMSTMGLPDGVETVNFAECSSLTSIQGLPVSVRYANFTKCTSLLHVQELPPRLEVIHFEGCTSLTSVLTLPSKIWLADFTGCISMVSVSMLPSLVEHASFAGCASLTSVPKLPLSVTNVNFAGCSSLRSVAGLPKSVTFADFCGCSSLLSVAGLPSSVQGADFVHCTSLTDVTGLAANVTARFDYCRRLRRFSKRRHRLSFWGLENPSTVVRKIMRLGVCGKLLDRVGPDVALLIGCFVTAGMNSSPRFRDRMETPEQVLRRYYTSK